MSLEVSLPPSLPDDATKSNIPPTTNIQNDNSAKLLDISISATITQTLVIDGWDFERVVTPMTAMASGVLARCLKAGVVPFGQEYAFCPLKTVIPLVDNVSMFMQQCTQYFYEIYQALVSGKTSIPYIPRNICFMLNAWAKNRIVSYSGNNTLIIMEWIIAASTMVPLTPLQTEKWATFFRMRQMAYDVVNVPVTESSSFPSSHSDTPSSPVNHVKLTLSQIGSSYCFYEVDNVGNYIVYDTMMETVQTGSWWIKAALSFSISNKVIGETVSSWRGICVHPNTLAAWVAYADTVSDVPYVISASYPYLPYVNKTTVPSQLAEFQSILFNLKAASSVAGVELTLGFFALSSNDQAEIFRAIFMFIGCIYSPFGLFASGSMARLQDTTSKDLDLRFAFATSYRGPSFFPSILHECQASLAESTIIKATQYGVTRTFQVFNMQFWPGISTTTENEPNGLNATNYSYYTVQQMIQFLTLWEGAFVYRKYLKMNMFPEFKVNKAIMPYFFLHVPYQRPGPAGIQLYDGLVTPYSTKYIEDHNFQMLGRSLIWPKVYQISPSMVEWLSIVDIRELPAGSKPWNLTLTDLPLLGYLCIDSSYQSDSCEIDEYLKEMRSKHLGFFAALAALAPSVISLGTSLFKAITKPSTVDAAMSTPQTKDDQIQTSNMSKAGISMLQQTTAGAPGSGGTLDLSRNVQVDPIDNIIDTGKRVFTNRQTHKYVDFAGKALKIGRTMFRGYKSGWK